MLDKESVFDGSRSGRIRALHVPGQHLCGLTWLGDLLWYSDGRLDEIVAINPQTGDVVKRLPCPGVRTGLTAADGGRMLLQVVGGDKRLRALDPSSGDVLGQCPNPRPGGELCGLQATAEGLWTGYRDPPTIDLRRHGDLKSLASFPVTEDVADLTVAGYLVVFANHRDARLNVLDPDTGKIVSVIPVSGAPTGVTWDGSRLWYCDHAGRRLCAVELGGAKETVA